MFKFRGFCFSVFILLVLSSFSVNGQSLDVRADTLQATILQSQETSFLVSIINNQDRADNIRISSLNIAWDVKPNALAVDPNSERTINLTLIPVGNKTPGDYGANIVFSSLTNQDVRVERLFKVKIIDPAKLVVPSVELPSEINPSERNLFRVILENENDLFLEDIKLELKSDFFEESRLLSLDNYESKSEDFLVEFKGDIGEGQYPLIVNIYYEDKLYVSKEFNMSFGYHPTFIEQVSPESSFLVRRMEVTKSNTGNTSMTEFYRKKISSFEYFFTSSEPEADFVSKENGFYVLKWEFDLLPGETKTILIKTDYRWLLIAFVLLVLVILSIYYHIKKDVSLTKKLVKIGKTKDGITKMRIVLTIKNKGRTLNNIKVMDRLTNVKEEPKEFGTLRPNKVIKKINGYELVWFVPHIGRKEEIVISYRASSQFKGMKLLIPRAHIRYMVGKRNVFVSSNKVKPFS